MSEQEKQPTVGEKLAQKQAENPTVQVETEPPRRELTDEERQALHAKLRQRMSKSKLSVEAPAGWTPYWARKDDATEMARLDFLGFRIVREKPEDTPRYKAQGRREDGTYIMGDVILMEIPSEEYEFYLDENAKRARQMPDAAKAKFVEEAEKQGSPTFQVKRPN